MYKNLSRTITVKYYLVSER